MRLFQKACFQEWKFETYCQLRNSDYSTFDAGQSRKPSSQKRAKYFEKEPETWVCLNYPCGNFGAQNKSLVFRFIHIFMGEDYGSWAIMLRKRVAETDGG